ncbi:MAG: hypothetical protein IPI81_01205 [Flavobacteriales bacterium]|nr:hypothetical protein [Flavobacteriales bacterium]MCC6939297.1 hypothetical protein [Flavobacteriales bacterium]
MFIGWVGVETMWGMASPPRIDAFLYYDDTLRVHLPLRRACLLGQRRMHSELRTLMEQPIAYNQLEKYYANLYRLKLAKRMWDMDHRRAQWREQCIHPHVHAFHSAFIHRALKPLNGCTRVAGKAPLRPLRGLCHEPGHLRVRLLMPDVDGTCLCNEPWQLYAKCWVPQPGTNPPTMVQPPLWTMLGAWHGAQRVCDGEWWYCEGVV